MLASNPFARHVAGELVQIERDLQSLLAAHRPIALDLPLDRFFGIHGVDACDARRPRYQGSTAPRIWVLLRCSPQAIIASNFAKVHRARSIITHEHAAGKAPPSHGWARKLNRDVP
jgi:hypothetical protein